MVRLQLNTLMNLCNGSMQSQFHYGSITTKLSIIYIEIYSVKSQFHYGSITTALITALL